VDKEAVGLGTKTKVGEIRARELAYAKVESALEVIL
jgi:hypothetical protein